LRYAGSFGLGIEESEDIVQEAFLALYRHLSLSRDGTSLVGWLFRVVHNLALKHRRTMGRRPVHHSWDDPLVRPQVDPAPNPELQVVHGERRRRLRAVVAALPDRERRCLVLRSEGLTYREIATALSLSLGAVAKSLARAMTRLAYADGG
jgi:RNA polymerase sigma-70 factor (ECF subfamily)